MPFRFSFIRLFFSGLFLFSLPLLVDAAVLSLSPETQTMTVGEELIMEVVLETDEMIDGVDIYYLNYDQDFLEVQDAESNTSGIQIAKGSLMDYTLLNNVDENNGRIVFSQVAAGGITYSGTGVLASITFQALKDGQTDIYFDFILGATDDTNVASEGNDVLTETINSVINIEAISDDSGGGTTGGGTTGGGTTGGGTTGGGTTGGGTTGGGTSNDDDSDSVNVEDNEQARIQELEAEIIRLQKLIAQVLLKIAALRGVQFSYTEIPTDFTFQHNLRLGIRSQEIKYLQVILKKEVGPLAYPDNVLATGWFGPITHRAAVVFQEKYADEILSPYGLHFGTGLVGRTTRAKLNQLLGH